MAGPDGGRLVDVEVEEVWDGERAAAHAALGVGNCVGDPAVSTVRAHGESEDGHSLYVISDVLLGVSFHAFSAALANAKEMPLDLAQALTSSLARVVETVALFGVPTVHSGVDFDLCEWWVSFDGRVRSRLALSSTQENRIREQPGAIRGTFWHLSPERL
jgi:hypothetical protein